MPRRNRPAARSAEPRPLGGHSSERAEPWRGVGYRVRNVTGSPTSGPYRCPGCDQLIEGTPHVVVWPEHDLDAGDRRHWHSACWSARDRRAPGIQRSRNAPRYG